MSEYDFIKFLISMVEENKCLYDKSDVFYFNKTERAKVWAKIAQAIGKSESECKNKWKLLRERFAKELKKRSMSSGSVDFELDEWQFFKNMKFLTTSIKPRRTQDRESKDTLVAGLEDCSNNSAFESISSSTQLRKRKASNTLESLCDRFGETLKKLEYQMANETFLTTMLSYMKDLPTDVKEDFQLEMLQTVMKLRTEHRKKIKHL